MVNHPNEVAAERLRNRCDPAQFTFTTTADLPTPERMVGQERAAEALDFGLAVPESTYNIFVAGPQGTGRTVSAIAAAEAMAKSLPVPEDWCYVHNFAQPYIPHPLALPAGTARAFAQHIDTLVESLRPILRETFDSEV